MTTKRAKLEAAITHLNEGIAVSGRPKKYEVIQRKVGRLLEKYKQVGDHYDVKVVKKKGKEILLKRFF